MEGVDYRNFDIVVGKMRKFFKEVKGFVEVHPQNKKSILAACEDPKTIATYNYEGQIWPLPQKRSPCGACCTSCRRIHLRMLPEGEARKTIASSFEIGNAK